MNKNGLWNVLKKQFLGTNEGRRKAEADQISLLSIRFCSRSFLYACQPAVFFT